MLLNTKTKTHIDLSTNKLSNLDLVLSTSNIAEKISLKVNDDTLSSDHFPIHLEINMKKNIYRKKPLM